MNIDRFAELIKTGEKTNEQVVGLAGRLIRGKKPEDFLTLSDDPTRKIVMLVDETGLASMLGKSGYDMLITIGYEPDYIRHKIDQGNQFKLVVFPTGGAAQLATWDNMIDMVAQVYPDIADVARSFRARLKMATFAQLERTAGFSFLEIEKAGSDDPRFMTYERFLQSDQSLVDFRAFLYFAVHLRELYAGNGYTKQEDGPVGVPEYIIPNKPLSELGDYREIDVRVTLPM